MQIQKNLQTFAAAPQASLSAAPDTSAENEARGHIDGFDLRNLDTSVDPTKDFYHYADGGWIKSHPIPESSTKVGSFTILASENLKVLHNILEAAAANPTAPAGSPERLIGDFYASGLDTAAIEAAGAKPLAPEFERISQIQNLGQLQGEVAHLQGLGLSPFFDFGATQDVMDSTKTTAGLDQAGLGLPNRDYYLKADERSVGIRSAYVDHVANMLQLLGDEPAAARKSAEAVMKIETRLAENSLDRVQLRDRHKTYNIVDRKGLAELAPSLDWNQYLSDRGQSGVQNVTVSSPAFLKGLDQLVKDTPLEDLKSYMRWNLIAGTADYLSKSFVDENFNFHGKVLSGLQEQGSRSGKVAHVIDRAVGDAIGQKYVEQNFSPEAKVEAQEILTNIKSVLREDLQTLPWLSPATRKEATDKLDKITDKIGYPDKWDDYKGLKIDRGSYVENVLRANQYAVDKQLARIDHPSDRTRWGQTPPTVNAYYNGSNNEIVFPAGILQAPFFDPKADPAINYGGIGVVIGHEIGHGFDKNGAQLDGDGNLRNWFTPEDKANFDQRSQGIINQANSFMVGENHLNGELVVGEATADLGGVELAFQAYEKAIAGKPRQTIDGFDPEQRFFLGFAQVWESNQRPQAAQLQIATDPHPVAEYRVNATLSNVPEFAQAFHAKEGDPLVRPAELRTELWTAPKHNLEGNIAA